MSNTRRVRPGPPRAAGFTLVELTVAMALLVMILGAIALAVQGATDAAEYGHEKSRTLAQATLSLNRMTTDLRRASHVWTAESRILIARQPDGEDRIYAWSGTPGDPLVYVSDDASNGATLVPNVRSFNISLGWSYSPVDEAVVPTSVSVELEVGAQDVSSKLETRVRLRRRIM